jgi:hypothetical protein
MDGEDTGSANSCAADPTPTITVVVHSRSRTRRKAFRSSLRTWSTSHTSPTSTTSTSSTPAPSLPTAAPASPGLISAASPTVSITPTRWTASARTARWRGACRLFGRGLQFRVHVPAQAGALPQPEFSASVRPRSGCLSRNFRSRNRFASRVTRWWTPPGCSPWRSKRAA